jgi:predicted N-acetyltransferase YhbS
MPATPYHFGPSAFIGLIFRKWLDIPVFVLANIIVDIEVLAIAVFGLGRPIHRYAHTLLIGAGVGVIWAMAAYPARPLFAKLMQLLRIPYKTNFRKMLISGVLGVWFHVLIDGIYHWDVRMFWPSNSKLLFNIVPHDWIEPICVVFFFAAIILYAFAVKLYLKEKISMQTRIVKETEITEKLIAAIRKTLAICFPHHKDEFSKTHSLNDNKPAFSVIIEDGGNVIAYVGVIDRTIKVGDRKYRVAGVQNICVLPKYRGRQLSDSILQAATAEAHQQKFDFGLLFTQEKIKKVYTHNGWLEIKSRKFIRTKNSINIEMPPESIKMYYPLAVKDFPTGDVDLLGNKW